MTASEQNLLEKKDDEPIVLDETIKIDKSKQESLIEVKEDTKVEKNLFLHKYDSNDFSIALLPRHRALI